MKLSEAIDQMIEAKMQMARPYHTSGQQDRLKDAMRIVDEMYEAAMARPSVKQEPTWVPVPTVGCTCGCNKGRDSSDG